MVQWLRIHLSMQGMQAQVLVGKLKSQYALGQLSQHATIREAHALQLEKSAGHNKESGCHSEDPAQTKLEEKKRRR